ncbi:MAG: hypothetical protein M1451_07250 [Acidobacteria bacterium]|nr:hypothetical protein [Acidobacteriota bacterium]
MSKPPSRPRRIALYGGSFDPIHALVRAMAEALDRLAPAVAHAAAPAPSEDR